MILIGISTQHLISCSMNRMKISITHYFLLLWSYTGSYATPENADIEVSINALRSIFYSSFWTAEVKSREIIINGKVTTLNEEFKTGIPRTEYLKKTTNIVEYTFKVSKIMYTTLKCKFSDLITSALYFFFDCIVTCKNLNSIDSQKLCVHDTVRHFVGLKRNFAKMTYDLMNFMKISPNLKSTDHALLKFLMSVNVFFNYVNFNIHQQPDNEYFTANFDAKLSITRIINLGERFRCKHCYDPNYFAFNEEIKRGIENASNNGNGFSEAIVALFRPTAQELNNAYETIDLKRTTGLEMAEYDDEMYDLEHSLLEEIFDTGHDACFRNVTVKWDRAPGKWALLTAVHREVATSGDLGAVFAYQVLLIETMKDFFYLRFVRLYGSTNAKHEYYESLAEFETFVGNTVPGNYPTALYGSMVQLRNAIRADLSSETGFASGDDHDDDDDDDHAATSDHRGGTRYRPLSVDTVNRLTDSPVVGDYGDCHAVEKYSSTIDFVNRVRQSGGGRSFDRFREVFALLAYQWNTLDEYRLVMVPRGDPAAMRQPRDETTCRDSRLLRHDLLAFQSLMNTAYRMADDYCARNDPSIVESIEHLRASAVLAHKTYARLEPAFGRVLWPLAVGLRAARPKQGGLDRHAALRLKQIAQWAANALEYLETATAVCAGSVGLSGLETFAAGEKSQNSPPNLYRTIRQYWQCRKLTTDRIADRTADQYDIDAALLDIYTAEIQSFVPSAAEFDFGSSSTLLVLWDGDLVPVAADLVGRDVVADHQLFVRYVLTAIKRAVAHAFSVMRRVLRAVFVEPAAADSELQLLNVAVAEFGALRRLRFPKAVAAYVCPVFDRFAATLQSAHRSRQRPLEPRPATDSLVDACLDDLRRLIDLFGGAVTDVSEQPVPLTVQQIQQSFRHDVRRFKRMFAFIERVKILPDDVGLSTVFY